MKKRDFYLLTVTSIFILSCGAETNSDENEIQIELPTSVEEPSLAEKTVDVFEEKFGAHEGERRNHIDGFCFEGYFEMEDVEIQKYSKSPIFSETSLTVMGRFSHKGGIKNSENEVGEYGMAFAIYLDNGNVHKFSMNTLDFFPVNSPEGFLQLMEAKVSGKTEDFDQLKIDHPEFVRYKEHYGAKPKVLATYANHQFNSINTFIFENGNGEETPVRWSFIPQNEIFELDTTEEIDFFQCTKEQINQKGELVWDMLVSIANTEDEINDASVEWEGKHEQIAAAKLHITSIVKSGDCDNMVFDPLALTEGVKPSDDPVLKFRSPAYAVSFSRRMQEK